MSSLDEYRVAFFAVVGILTLLVASPALIRLLVFPRTDFFTELWLLGPNHKAEDYPFNVTRGGNNSVYLGIGNQLGYCAYYMVQVKLRSQNQSAPTSFGPIANRTPSSLSSLFNLTAFVADESVWEVPLTLSFDYSYNETLSNVKVRSIALNDRALDIENCTLHWDTARKGFLADLFFETWLYNGTSRAFQYHGRFVGLWLNMTV